MRHAKRFLTMLLSLSLVLSLIPSTVFAADSELPFADVTTKDWFYDAVQYVYDRGMMNGTSQTAFSPAGTTTRGMIVAVLHRMEGAPAATGTTFSDVPADHWCASAVTWASANNIVTGYSNGTFGPANAITREQLSAILYRYSQFKGYDTSAADNISGFSDAAQVSSFATDSMSWAVGSGLITGLSNHTLMPKGNATRAQVATILMRYCGNFASHQADQKGTFTVVFDLNYGSNVQHTVKSVKAGEPVSKPANPARSGYYFGGWYTERTGGTRFDFNQGITSDLILYAHWTLVNNSGSNNVSGSGSGGTTTSVPSSTDDKIYINQGQYVALPDENNIKEDLETGLKYINNELIVHAEIGVSKDQIVELLNSYGGKIVGEISITNSYQVRFSNIYTYEELTELKNNLGSSPLVSWTSINLVFNEETDYFPMRDVEWKNEWNDNVPYGQNWGVEAINAPGAWEYRDAMSYTNVGVYDNYFYSHNDLTYMKRFSNTVVPDTSPTHGTHVSGTIAAGFDNDIGISGVAPHVNLYGFSISMENQVSTIAFAYELVLATLIGQEHCKVINVSLNTGMVECFAASKGNRKATTYIIENATEMGRYLKRLLDNGNDFVLCVAAGNVNGYKFVLNKSDKYGYSVYDPKNPNGTPIQGGAQAAYNNFLNAITISEIKSRIIVIGSCKNNENGTYTYSDFSNIGVVDVVAPGEAIYSTINNNSYGPMWGTSMATPHVSGIAAMLYSINPQITGDRVKQIICETSTTSVRGCSYKMADAAEAVRRAYINSSAQMLTLDGKIVDQNSRLPISNATVSIKDHSGHTIRDTVSDDNGEFSIAGIEVNYGSSDIFWDTYSVEVKKDGYVVVLMMSSNVTIIDKVYNLGTIFLEAITPVEPVDPAQTLQISGTIKDSVTNMALINVDIYIYDENGFGPITTGKTGNDGAFSINLDESGTYTVKFTKEGYAEKTESVTVGNNTTSLGTITLVRNSSGGDVSTNGDGTEANPYQISTAEQLQNVVNDLSASYILVADIDCSQLSDWTSIGTEENSFSGHFDGDGHSISNLTCSQGLFGYISRLGTVENVNLSNFEVSAGQCGGFIASHNNGVIQYCKISGSISGTTGHYLTNFVGGVVGDNAGTVQYCSVSTTGDETMAGTTIGGIAGRNTGRVISCISSCSITGRTVTDGTGLSLVGGIVGYNYGGTINLCKNTSDIVTSIVYAGCACGGIAGANTGTINTNYSNGRVYAHATTTNYGARAGGIVGSNGDRWLGKGGTVSQCVYELSEGSSATGLDASDSSYCGTIENNYDSALSGAEIIGKIEDTLNF